MVQTFVSSFVLSSGIEGFDLLEADRLLYNKMFSDAVSATQNKAKTKEQRKQERLQRKEAGLPPKKAGGGKRQEGEQSLHTWLKDTYGVTDYFVSSVESDCSGCVRSAAECRDRSIAIKKQRIEQMKAKIDAIQHIIDNYTKLKASLIQRSKVVKNGGKPPKLTGYQGSRYSAIDYFDSNNRFTHAEVVYTPFAHGKGACRQTIVYPNEYIFETEFLNPKIRALKNRIVGIKMRIHNTQEQIDALTQLKEANKVNVRFVSRKRIAKWKHLSPKDRLRLFDKHKQRDILLAGRHDAKQGNFMVKYNPETQELVYRTADGKHYITIPNVAFRYGADKIANAMTATKALQKAVGWKICFRGKRIQIQCIITTDDIPAPENMTNGLVAVDMNYDNIAVSRVSGTGQLMSHKVLSFNPEGMNTNQYTYTVSQLLESVFRDCVAENIPFACEDIKDIQTKAMYGNAKRNRHISMFAYSKIQQFVETKSHKYNIPVKQVNPAYTSQIGKHKYMKSMHLTVHEAASYCIGRRALGYTERVSVQYKQLVDKSLLDKPRLRQWKSVFNALRNA